MRRFTQIFIAVIVIFAFFSSALPCGPGYISPVFEYESAPENPYENFAAGNLGIVKPGFHRSVLFAAYRYINGGGFTPDEQKALVEVWRADFNNKDYLDTDINDAVRAWVEKRKEVVGKEEKTPDIYVERNYGGYDFFPNCTKNAFETASETLSDRVSAHGPSDTGVADWVKAQDQVFSNCSSGKQTPEPAAPGSPDWLQKDRAYQIAAASFYSLDYNDAKKRFADIAQDFDSPWRETADYLVARTLIRQASLSKTPEKGGQYYAEAEERLQKFTSGKFAESAERLLGLIKYRLHPKERVGELARKLMIQGGNPNFRQDLVDYTWLTDKFAKEILEAEEKRKEEENKENSANTTANAVGNAMNAAANAANAAGNAASTAANTMSGASYAERLSNAATTSSNTRSHLVSPKKNDDDIEIYLYSSDSQKSWTFYVRANATDDEAIAEAEKIVGQPLTAEMKKNVRAARQAGYASRFSQGRQSDYQGGYYGNEKISLSLLPGFLRSDELTEWVFVYQVKDIEAYLYSLSKFRSTGSDLWLMTAISKADKNSTQLPRLMDAAARTSHSSPAFQTIAYHEARLLIEQGKNAEAKKLLDDVLSTSSELTISARNQFLGLRLKLAESLEDFLKYSLRKPFAFDFDGSTGTIDEFIEQEKQWYDPQNDKQTKEEYAREIEDRFKEERLWQDRLMFDTGTIETINEHFPLSVLAEVERSPAIPDYLRERFAIPIWTRAVLLEDYAAAEKIAPEVIKYRPEFAGLMNRVMNAKTPAAKQNAILFFILKNPILSPYVEDGLGKTDNEFGSFDSNDWWCAPYETEYDEASEQDVPKKAPSKPVFLSDAQSRAAKAERARLKDIGDAPKFLADKVMAWAKRSPMDRRIPESLFIVYEANGWTKYGCGSNTDLHDEIGAYLKKHYPQSAWTQKMTDEEKGDQ